MAEANSLATGSVTLTQSTSEQPRSPNVVLKLRKPKSDKKVQWQQGTVDNEFMGKKKSKCCCIYEKPKLFGESSEEDDDDDGCSPHCRGHKKKCYQGDPSDQAGASGGEGPSTGGGGG